MASSFLQSKKRQKNREKGQPLFIIAEPRAPEQTAHMKESNKGGLFLLGITLLVVLLALMIFITVKPSDKDIFRKGEVTATTGVEVYITAEELQTFDAVIPSSGLTIQHFSAMIIGNAGTTLMQEKFLEALQGAEIDWVMQLEDIESTEKGYTAELYYSYQIRDGNTISAGSYSKLI